MGENRNERSYSMDYLILKKESSKTHENVGVVEFQSALHFEHFGSTLRKNFCSKALQKKLGKNYKDLSGPQNVTLKSHSRFYH